MKALSEADIFIAIGTSGVVYPAAGFVSCVGPNCRRVLINKDEPENNNLFKEVHLGSATQIVRKFFFR